MWGESSPTCLLCTHNGHICLPFPGANRDISATFLFHGALFLRIPAQPNGTEVRVSSPQILARPSPTAAHLSSEAAGHSPLPPLSRHGAGRGVRPQAWGTKRAVGQGGLAEGSRAPGLPRTPLPPLLRGRRREPPGPVGKMADRPGVACHPRRLRHPASRVRTRGGGRLGHPRNSRRPVASLRGRAASASPSTSPPRLSLSHPIGAPRADAPGDPATRLRPTPTPPRPGRVP